MKITNFLMYVIYFLISLFNYPIKVHFTYQIVQRVISNNHF